MDVPYKRILIAGCGGAGKSVLASRLGKKTGLPVVHLDRLWWLPGWVERSREEFDTLLERELEKPAWIIEGNYSRTFPRRLRYADLCVFLDLDVETCLAGAQDRAARYAGRTRPDMTEGCPERMDGEFVRWIEDFAQNTRPGMLRAMEESGVPYKVFATRRAAYEWFGLEETL